MAPTSHLTSDGSAAHCYVCRNLDYHCSLPLMSVGTGYELVHIWRPFSEFENSADEGCPVCWVLASIRSLLDDTIDAATNLQVNLGADGDVTLRCDNCPDLDLYVPRDNHLGVPGEKASLFQSLQVKADISESAWSETAQRFARDCTQACIGDHELCRLGESLLPKRVISVGNTGDEQLRLYETRRGTSGLYTALSYCWGGDQQLKTTSATIEDMMSGLLRLSDLPQTLADAVHVTRSLGLQYLWVDALCIIQDNVEDWERESEQMASIYENAYLVIAAASSSSVTQGFLDNQRQKLMHRFDIHSTHGTKSSVAAREKPWGGLHDSIWSAEKTDPLAQRAWAFQEQHMSTRCLIFSTDELQWVCKTKAACECGEPTMATRHYLQAPSVNWDDTQQGDGASHQLALQDMWYEAVENYSHRKLTQPDDKLPALSGLASRFGARTGFRYVAGLWEQNTIHGLTWMRSNQSPPVPINSTAPSFSWASIDCGVKYHLAKSWAKNWDLCSFVLNQEATVPGHNPFGKVRDAWMTIQGPMVRGTLHGGYDWPQFFSDDGKLDFRLAVDCVLTVFSYATAGNGTEISVRRRRHLPPYEDSTMEAPEDNDRSPLAVEPFRTSGTMHSDYTPASVWLLHLGRTFDDQTRSKYGDVGYSHDFYLVLGRPAHDPEKYERIGYCYTLSEELLEKHSERFTTRTIIIV